MQVLFIIFIAPFRKLSLTHWEMQKIFSNNDRNLRNSNPPVSSLLTLVKVIAAPLLAPFVLAVSAVSYRCQNEHIMLKMVLRISIDNDLNEYGMKATPNGIDVARYWKNLIE